MVAVNLKSHGVMVGLALALLTASGCFGAGRTYPVAGGKQRRPAAPTTTGWPLRNLLSARQLDTIIRSASSAANEGMVKRRNREDLDACDVGDPARMHADGLDDLRRRGEGPTLLFRNEDCESGPRLPLGVLLPQPEKAEAPAPVSSASLGVLYVAWTWLGLLFCSMVTFIARY